MQLFSNFYVLNKDVYILIGNECFDMMKNYRIIFKVLVFTALIYLVPSTLTAQTSMNVEGFGQKWVNFGDADVNGSQITLEAIVRRQNNANIVSKHDGPTDVNYLLRPNSFQITTTDGFYICLNTYTLAINTWYHVAATYDGAVIKYYVDGCLVNQVEATGDIVTNDWDGAIGNRSNWPNGPEQFRGRIDEVRIWKEARTEEEIKLNMNLILNPTAEPNLVAYYRLDNNYTNAQGSSAFDGVPQGTPVFAAASPLFIPFEVLSVTQTDVSCYGFSDGEINVIAIGSDLEYSLDGITYVNTSSFTDLGPGIYTVFIRGGACEETTTIEIMEPSEIPTPVMTINDPICSTDTLFLSTSEVSNASYFWNGPNGFFSSNFSTSIANLTSSNSGDYSIYLEVDGCYSDTTVQSIVVNETYDINIIDTICSNQTYTFGLEELNSTGTYIQNLQSISGCDSTVQLNLTVNPSYSFVVDTAICQGESITFEGVTMDVSGSYPFNLFTTLGCDSIITYELIVHPIPEAPIISSNSPLECPGDFYEFGVSSVEDGFYEWSGPNQFTSTDELNGFDAQISDMGLYTVSVTVNNCVSPLSQTELEVINIYSFDDFDFPNVVTPNGDGTNDSFDLESYFKTCTPYEILFFDRWGNPVYQHKKNETPFSGNSFDGSELMDGVYFYKLHYGEGLKQGFVQLIR